MHDIVPGVVSMGMLEALQLNTLGGQSLSQSVPASLNFLTEKATPAYFSGGLHCGFHNFGGKSDFCKQLARRASRVSHRGTMEIQQRLNRKCLNSYLCGNPTLQKRD